MHLGSLSPVTEKVAEAITFDWYGETFTAQNSSIEITMADFLDRFGDIDMEDREAMVGTIVALKAMARDLVIESEFDHFWSVSRKNRVGALELMGLFRALVEQVADRPTGLPSGSTDGQSATPRSSARTPEWIAESAAPGRPDLQVVIADAQRTA